MTKCFLCCNFVMWSIRILLWQLLLLAGRQGRRVKCICVNIFTSICICIFDPWLWFSKIWISEIFWDFVVAAGGRAGGRRGSSGKKQGKKEGSMHTTVHKIYTEKLDPRLQKDIIQNLQNIQKESTLAANDTGESNYNTAAVALQKIGKQLRQVK